MSCLPKTIREKNISIAAAEIERLRANRKLTSRGKNNRAKLLKNCESLSVGDLIVYMEKEKSKLRKLKKKFWRVEMLEEARKLNRKFYEDSCLFPPEISSTVGARCAPVFLSLDDLSNFVQHSNSSHQSVLPVVRLPLPL